MCCFWSLGVELLARLCVVLEQLAGFEAVAVLLHELFHFVDVHLRPHRVEELERAAVKRREPDAEDGADVAVRRRADDAVFEALDGLVDKAANVTVLDHLDGDVGVALLDVRGNVLFQLGVGRLFLAFKDEKALSSLAAEPAAVDHLLLQRRVRPAHALAHGRVGDHGQRGLVRHVGADLVGQRHGPDRETQVQRGLFHLRRRHAVGEELRQLGHHGRDGAVDVEARDVLDFDARLALPDADGKRPRHRLVARPGVRDHLQQRHLRHRRKVVEAHDALRARRAGRDPRDGDCGSVCREDSVVFHQRLDGLEDGVLQLNVLEDGLDEDVNGGGAAPERVRRRPGAVVEALHQ
mmetsp:Transcript_128/g.504  ORF Transcript_128/g.504 Transcript_128/m.504 type:complete len:351 (-) Transcript_128:1343-2395(-)